MSSRDPRSVLRAHGLWTKKHFGQNFLIGASIPSQIAAAGGALADDVVFEIGAGCGTLTHALAPIAARVIALEHDRDLVPVARAELSYAPNVEIREGNVLDVDWSALRQEVGRPVVIYGNLPYHLSTPIVLGLLGAHHTWRRACFMLQREFAERLAAPPGTRKSSALSVQAALWAHTSMVFHVPAFNFHPAPKVESTVVVMERRASLPVDVGDPKAFRGVVRALFAQRRKMARRALASIYSDPTALLEAAGVEGTRRGETFNLAELAAITRAWVQLRQRD
jgi:16S rRNA (adenine1518-N6/adenine1519-N6)-dimethyltransferase